MRGTVTEQEHTEQDNAVGVLPGMTARQQREAETDAIWLPALPEPNTLTRGTLAN